MPLAVTTVSFKNGKTASPLPVTQCSLSYVGRQPAYDTALQADQIFGINILLKA